MRGIWFKLKDRRGQALVEMVLILPIFLLLVFGIIEYGRIFSTNIIINNAARGGARMMAVASLDETTLKSTVKEMCYTTDKTKPGFIVDVNYKKADGTSATVRTSGGTVQIDITYPLTIYAPIISNITGNPHTVNAQATMYVE